MTPLDPDHEAFWTMLDTLVAGSEVVIDRPQGSPHPRYPQAIYPLDYGYLEGTHTADCGGIDVWRGADGSAVDAILVTLDTLKRDAEIKVLIGVSAADRGRIIAFHRSDHTAALLITRPDASHR